MLLLKRVFRTLRRDGVLALARLSIQYIIHVLYLPYGYFRIRNLERDSNPDTLIDYAYTGFHGLIRPLQSRSEIHRLLEILAKMKPGCIVEIGTARGGTLFLFSRIAAEDATLVSIDYPGGWFGGGYPVWKIPFFKSFALDKQKIYPVLADSHQDATLEKVNSIINPGQIDFLFIDGDHSYEGVKKDFEMYSPLVRKNGIIAFHDIALCSSKIVCEVNRYWDEIKTGYEYEEIIEEYNHQWLGMGLIKVRGTPQ